MKILLIRILRTSVGYQYEKINQIQLHFTCSFKTKNNLKLSIYLSWNCTKRKTRSLNSILSDSRASSSVFKLIQFEVLRIRWRKNLKFTFYNLNITNENIIIASTRVYKRIKIREQLRRGDWSYKLRLFCP